MNRFKILTGFSTITRAVPGIIRHHVNSIDDIPRIGLAVSEKWQDRFYFRRIFYDIAFAVYDLHLETLNPKTKQSASEICAGLDALVIAGGEDIHPESHGIMDSKNVMRSQNKLRDKFEIKLLETALHMKLPILGICRGMQLVALWAGGAVESHDHDKRNTKEHVSFPFKLLFAHHDVLLAESSLIAQIYQADHIDAVNSFHHHSVVDPGALRITARTKTGRIEAVEATEYDFALGVQWHPEIQMLYAPQHRKLFNAFFEAAQRYRSHTRS